MIVEEAEKLFYKLVKDSINEVIITNRDLKEGGTLVVV